MKLMEIAPEDIRTMKDMHDCIQYQVLVLAGFGFYPR
jgi:hypothetical protein